MIRHRRTARILGACLGVVALAGCAHDPGSAFSVGDRSVSRDTIDTVVQAQCSLIADTAQQQGQQTQPQPRSGLTWTIVDALLLATEENAYGDEFSVGYDGTSVRQARTQLASQGQNLSASRKQALTDAIVGVVRGQAIAQSVGKAELARNGATKPSTEEIGNAGLRVIRSWAEKQGVSVNPRYNVGPSDRAGAGDGSLSEPVSSYAKAAAKASTSAGFLSQLPPGQLCG